MHYAKFFTRIVSRNYAKRQVPLLPIKSVGTVLQVKQSLKDNRTPDDSS